MVAHRQREQHLERALLLLLGPEPHGDRRHQQDQQERQRIEQATEVRDAAREERLDVEEREQRRSREGDQEHVSDRGIEISAQLAHEHGAQRGSRAPRAHARRGRAHATAPTAEVVSSRNTCSSERSSRLSSRSFQPRRCTRSETASPIASSEARERRSVWNPSARARRRPRSHPAGRPGPGARLPRPAPRASPPGSASA